MQNLPSNKCNTYGLNSTSRYFSFFPRKNTSATKIQESVWRHQCICIGMVSQCSSILSHLNYQTRCDWCVKRVNFRLKFGHVSNRANILLTMNGRTRNLARGLHNGLTQRPLEHELRLLESSEPIPPRKQQNQGSKYTRSNHKDHPMWQQLKFNLEPRISSRGSNLFFFRDFPLLFRKKRPVASTVYNVCLLPKSNQT